VLKHTVYEQKTVGVKTIVSRPEALPPEISLSLHRLGKNKVKFSQKNKRKSSKIPENTSCMDNLLFLFHSADITSVSVAHTTL